MRETDRLPSRARRRFLSSTALGGLEIGRASCRERVLNLV